MPKKTGPFLAAIIGAGRAYAVDVATYCPDCYRCTAYSGNSCTNCVYDPDYCAGTDNPWGQECNGHAVYDETLRTCVCDKERLYVCLGQWEFYDNSDYVCDCATTDCPSGQYASALNTCKACQQPDWTLTSSCVIASDKTLSNSGTGAYGGAYNGCYIAQGCVATDDTGTFELTANCLYGDVNGAIDKPIGGGIELN